MTPRLTRKLVVVLALSLLATFTLVASASAAQFDPVLSSMTVKKSLCR